MYSVTVKTALPATTFVFESMTGHEALGRLSSYEISLLSDRHDLQAEDLLGQPVVVTIGFAGQRKRVIHAYVSGFDRSAESGGVRRWTRYHLQAHCWLWFLTRASDCRIFQHKKVTDIVAAILKEPQYQGFALRDDTESSHRLWEYAVQYRETDFNFVCRLLEQEGIYFYFEHHENGHVMVLSDRSDKARPMAANPTLRYVTNPGDVPDHEVVTSWSMVKNIQPSKYVLVDYNPLEKARKILSEHYAGNHGIKRPDTEMYDYPGEFENDSDAKDYAKIRTEELHSAYSRYSGTGSSLEIRPGFYFQVSGLTWKKDDREFLITDVNFQVTENGYESGGGVTDYSCGFQGIPLKQVFRPSRLTPKPMISGLQTARVTGPQGSEIHSNEHLQVKVRFHWDRNFDRLPDEQSSCWVRVAQMWAGKTRGFIAVPRVGDEVVVAFEEGDPDRPLVIGSVYNDLNRNRHAIRSNETRTGLVTLSSKQGAENFNELTFEDNKGSELVYLRAEKDWRSLVKHDVQIQVDHDASETIDNNRTSSIGSDDSLKVGRNRQVDIGENETCKIGSNRTSEIGQNETLKVADNRETDIGANDTLKAGTCISIKAGQAITIEAGTTITLKAGPSTIELGPSGITIKGPIVKVN